MRKIAENCRKIAEFDINFLGLRKIAVNPAPLCTVPEVKEKNFTSPKRGISKLFNKTICFGVTKEILITLTPYTWVFLVEGYQFLTP